MLPVATACASARLARAIDVDCLAELLAGHPGVLTAEDHTAAGGFGSAVLEAAAEAGLDARCIHRAAVTEEIVEHDSRTAQLARAGLSAVALAETCRRLGAPA